MGFRTVNVSGLDGNLVPTPGRAMQSVAVGGTEVAIGTLSGDTSVIFWSNAGQDIRVRFDGTAPTAGVGHVIAAGATGTWSATLARAAQLIATTGNAVFTVTEMTY